MKLPVTIIFIFLVMGCEEAFPDKQESVNEEFNSKRLTSNQNAIRAIPSDYIEMSSIYLDSTFRGFLNHENFFNKDANFKDTDLQNALLALLEASKSNLVMAYDRTVVETKKRAIEVTGQRIETEKQFALGFINGLVGIAKNSSSVISNEDVGKINKAGESFIELLLSIAEKEKSFKSISDEKNKSVIFNELFKNKKQMQDVIIKTKRAFEKQNGVQLSSTELFTEY